MCYSKCALMCEVIHYSCQHSGSRAAWSGLDGGGAEGKMGKEVEGRSQNGDGRRKMCSRGEGRGLGQGRGGRLGSVMK